MQTWGWWPPLSGAPPPRFIIPPIPPSSPYLIVTVTLHDVATTMVLMVLHSYPSYFMAPILPTYSWHALALCAYTWPYIQYTCRPVGTVHVHTIHSFNLAYI